VLLLELPHADALLAVGLCFGGAVGVDAAFGEEVGAATSDDEGGPAVAISLLDSVGGGNVCSRSGALKRVELCAGRAV